MDREADKIKCTAFTLLELLIAISIMILISAALYFSLSSAFQSWDASQDQLILQQVSSRLMEELSEGLPGAYGLRDSLELVNGAGDYITVIMPWSDNTQRFSIGVAAYTLNKHIKPGTSCPIAEALLPEQEDYQLIPISLIDKGKSDDFPQVFVKVALPEASSLRFTFHPDYSLDRDTATTYRYDASEQAVFIEDKDGVRSLSKNPFGVKITDFLIRYYDNTNTEAGINGSISKDEIPSICGLEVSFTAASKTGNTRLTRTFISLRNASAHSGNFTLKEEAVIPIPNSAEVKALLLTNLYGIDNGDTLILQADSDKGEEWVVSVKFAKKSMLSAPVIAQYTIEYPEGNKVYFESPGLAVEAGLNLLMLGPSGLYDYDIDDVSGEVDLRGKVKLEVKKMDIGGASVFVRP